MRILLVSLVLVLLACVSASAETKIGFVDMKMVIAKSEAGSKAMDSLKSQFKDMKDNLDTQKKSLDALREELQKQSMMLSQQAKNDKEDQYKRKVRDFQDSGQNYQRKLQQAEQNLSKPIIDKLVEVLQAYGKSHGFTAILDKQGAGVVYFDDGADLTNEIITELNKAMRK